MIRRLQRAPLAITTDGTWLINVAMFDVPKHIESLMKLAVTEQGDVFIGIASTREEARFVLGRLHDAAYEACALAAGRRQRRSRRRT